jgi:hypothetical protein
MPASPDFSDINKSLYEATGRGDIAAMRDALAKGADILHQDGAGFTNCLQAACNVVNGDRVAVMKFLLDNGADPNQGNRRGYTALHTACHGNQEDLVELLLDYGADPNLYTRSGMNPPEGQTALHEAVEKNRRNVIDPLLMAGADPHATDFHGKTPEQRMDSVYVVINTQLHEHSQLPVIESLASLDKAALFANQGGSTVLDNPATWRDWPQIVETLAQKGETVTKADLMQTGANGVGYLHRAAQARMLGEVVKGLNAQGEALSVSELLEHDTTIAPLLARHHVPCALFTAENMALQEKQQLRHEIQRLPAEGRSHIPNLHSLTASLRQSQQASGYGR